MNNNPLRLYYAATALFVVLDYGFGINVRAAFLEATPGLRLAYYVVLLLCFALTMWRPGWITVIAVVESLATLTGLIVDLALRSMIVTDAMLETGTGFVTVPEIINFLIVGGAAYVAYARGMRQLQRRSQNG